VLRTALHGRERERVVLSPPEHRALTGIRHIGPAPVGVLIRVQESTAGRHDAEGNPGRDAALAFESAGRPVAQRLFMTDVLGLVGGRGLPTAAVEEIENWWPDHLPVLPLEVLDLGELPTTPLWPQLLSRLAWRTEPRS
jgi:hypothetical protein